MKKTFLFGIALVGIFLTSCLGDNESTQTESNQFGIVKVKNGMKYAAVGSSVGGWNLVNPAFDQYQEGDGLFISSYKVSSKDFIDQDLIKAEYVSVSEKYIKSNQKIILKELADTISNVKDSIGGLNLTCVSFSPVEFFNNKVLFEYTVGKKEGETYDVKFVYDKDKQVDQSGEKLTNGCVVDVFFDKRGTGIGDAEAYSKKFVVDFSNLRLIVRPSEIPAEGLSTEINLRYSKYNAAKKKFELVYIPRVLFFSFRK